jgi:hypothetical protein
MLKCGQPLYETNQILDWMQIWGSEMFENLKIIDSIRVPRIMRPFRPMNSICPYAPRMIKAQ